MGDLKPKQVAAISAMLTCPTLREAAEASGTPESTLFRWLNEPDFKAAYDQARGRLLESTLTALQGAATEAVNVLRTIMNNGAAPAGVRVRAAVGIIELSLRARTELETEARLQALEAAAARTPLSARNSR